MRGTRLFAKCSDGACPDVVLTDQVDSGGRRLVAVQGSKLMNTTGLDLNGRTSDESVVLISEDMLRQAAEALATKQQA
ncbi:MAG TPA: hypothetical protein VLF40_06450 [Candidatus Saccharimonadales bacterium]|nr:hypothetical protein [Candidatus Saccharimonadales bacterium]